MPAAPLVPARQVDRARAFALVVQGIRAQAAVCEALEQRGPQAMSLCQRQADKLRDTPCSGKHSAAATTGARTAGECAPSPAPSPDPEPAA
jgi:hypothetical protein